MAWKNAQRFIFMSNQIKLGVGAKKEREREGERVRGGIMQAA